MYIERPKKKHKQKIYNSVLLRESYRDNGKVRKRTILNISNWPQEKITALEMALNPENAGKYDINDMSLSSGKAAGGIIVLNEIAKSLGLAEVFGKNKKAILTLVMIFGRILFQGSRRALTFWQQGQALQEVLGCKNFNTDDLYETLDWIDANKKSFEKSLYQRRYNNKPMQLCLYDVTSSYLEGEKNELADYGYNRDKKKGKKQIVVGMLTDDAGYPIGVEVFKGNTSDIETVPEQIKKLAKQFNIKDIIFVGDRAMVKKTTKKYLTEEEWTFISAITKAQIKSLINQDVIQLELFEDQLVEVEHDNKRYILRRNPDRAKLSKHKRAEKIAVIQALIEEQNKYLQEHAKASVNVAKNKIEAKINKLGLNKFFTEVACNHRTVYASKDNAALKEWAKYDGCYVIVTDVSKEIMNTKQVHQRYKDLAMVERCFRLSKTGFLEIRPLYVRKANRTRAIAFICMCAYMILREIWQKVQELNVPLIHVIDRLEQIQLSNIQVKNITIPMLPTIIAKDQQDYLRALGIALPKKLKI